MGSTRLLAAGTALVGALAGATPAWAAPPPEKPTTEMLFSISAVEVTPGTRIVLSGRAGFVGRDTGNSGKVDFYFRKLPDGKKVHLGSVRSSSSGAFRFPVKATTSGEYSAEYQHSRNKSVIGDGTHSMSVYTMRPVDQLLYTWTATNLTCLPACTTTGPEQFINDKPVRVTLTRECLQPKSGGRIGFSNDPSHPFKPGNPGWRDFPAGAGPTEFELTPGITRGRFYLEWTSGTPVDKDGLPHCNLSFTATQKDFVKEYVR